MSAPGTTTRRPGRRAVRFVLGDRSAASQAAVVIAVLARRRVLARGRTGPDSDVGSTANVSATGKVWSASASRAASTPRSSATPATVWKTQVSAGRHLRRLISRAAYADGLIFAASNDAAADRTVVAALDAARGDVSWQRALRRRLQRRRVPNGVVYVGTMSGTISALDARERQALWHDAMPDVAGSPAIADGMYLDDLGLSACARGRPARHRRPDRHRASVTHRLQVAQQRMTAGALIPAYQRHAGYSTINAASHAR